MALALIPQKKVRISTNGFFAIAWVFLAMELVRIVLPASAAEAVVIAPPFRGEWYIFQGGRSVLINHHYAIRAQRHALDIMKPVDGRDFQGEKGQLTSYPAYGQVLYAPADGTVVEVVNDRPDNAIGKTDLQQIVGNHVIMDIGGGRFALLAHLKQGSVRVAAGEKVSSGQAIAECGNSGNTSAPHLHLQIQDQADFFAKGLRTFPIMFRDVERVRTGRREKLAEADVRRNDRVLGVERAIR
jgi:hypothetical protein